MGRGTDRQNPLLYGSRRARPVASKPHPSRRRRRQRGPSLDLIETADILTRDFAIDFQPDRSTDGCHFSTSLPTSLGGETEDSWNWLYFNHNSGQPHLLIKARSGRLRRSREVLDFCEALASKGLGELHIEFAATHGPSLLALAAPEEFCLVSDSYSEQDSEQDLLGALDDQEAVGGAKSLAAILACRDGARRFDDIAAAEASNPYVAVTVAGILAGPHPDFTATARR